MRWYSHLSFGFAVSGLLLPFWDYRFALIVIIGSLLPDLDYPYSFIGSMWPELSNFLFKRFGHRGLLHSVWIPLSLLIDLFVGNTYILLFGLCYTLHILLDMMTYQGVKLLYPFDYYFTILDGELESNSTSSNLKVTIGSIAVLIVWLVWRESILSLIL